MMAVDLDGKESSTEFQLIDNNKGYCLVKALPITGRTHQIRVHAKYKNCPLVGDGLYGPKKDMEERLMLHASKISFIHPFTKQKISIQAPIPKEIHSFMEKHNLSYSY